MSSEALDPLHKEVLESKRKWIAEASKDPAELPSNKLIFCNQWKGETNHICRADHCRHYLKMLTSLSNPKLKFVRSLSRRRARIALIVWLQ